MCSVVLVMVATVCVCVSQALDGAMKQFKSDAPNTPTMLLSVDEDTKKFICICTVPNVRRYIKCTTTLNHIL